ncbi:MAG: YdcF family protein [Bacteroidota bacterium]
MWQKFKRFTARRWVRRAALLLLLWVSIHIIYITIDGFRDYKANADVAIIEGNAVNKDGSLSPWLKGRVDEALHLYQAGRVKKIFASGGNKGEPAYPEGDAMKKYLIRQGVPMADIIADNKGQNTFLTSKDFMDWNKTQHYTSAIVVTQFYHISRSKYILRKLGFKNVYGASSKAYGWRDVIGTVREVPAFYKYVLVY